MSVWSEASIMIVDDEPANVRLLERVLAQAGYASCVSTTDAREFWTVFTGAAPDLVLLDLHMPHVDGYEILARIGELGEAFLPVLVLTADITPDARREALDMGAKDFLTKPFDALEVLQRVRNLLHTRQLTLTLSEQNATLERRVHERTAELADANLETVERLAIAAEHRDDETGEHIRSVGRIAALIASACGLTEREAELIGVGAPLHDIGKIGLPDSILAKPGKLTDEERLAMQAHTTLGGRILESARTPLLMTAHDIALNHHERWDGTGYPNGLAGDAIPFAARITAVADVYDALTRQRRYKPAWPPDAAIAEIGDAAGTHFDPAVAAAFATIARDGTLEYAQRTVGTVRVRRLRGRDADRWRHLIDHDLGAEPAAR